MIERSIHETERCLAEALREIRDRSECEWTCQHAAEALYETGWDEFFAETEHEA